MGIIAVLMLLSLTGFFVLREQAIVDQTAEGLLSSIREAQNRATSISPDRAGNDTKVWVVNVAGNNFSLISIFDNGSGGVTSYTESQNLNPQATSISIGLSGGTTTGSASVAFTSPFAEAYLLSSGPCIAGECSWSRSTKPTEEWEIAAGTASLVTGTNILTFNISRGTHTSKVIVESNGDSRIE